MRNNHWPRWKAGEVRSGIDDIKDACYSDAQLTYPECVVAVLSFRRICSCVKTNDCTLVWHTQEDTMVRRQPSL